MNDHIIFDENKFELKLLDQRELPKKQIFRSFYDYKNVIEAIRNMTVRGAPAIGITAGYAGVLAAKYLVGETDFIIKLNDAFNEIEKARPTAVNLKWTLDNLRPLLVDDKPHIEILALLLEKAKKIHGEDIFSCKKIGEYGETLLKSGDCILTHCNAGALATGGFGTALGVIRAAAENGKQIRVIADETRPLMQGSRLTAWELLQDKIPVKIACDNAAAFLMQKGMIDIVITGADRIALNGDTANKIGTLSIAISAYYHKIPLYIAAPLSTVDSKILSGSEIPIEERSREEIKFIGSEQIAPQEIDAINFAFDITPANLITGIITEKGILYPPFIKSISNALNRAE